MKFNKQKNINSSVKSTNCWKEDIFEHKLSYIRVLVTLVSIKQKKRSLIQMLSIYFAQFLTL